MSTGPDRSASESAARDQESQVESFEAMSSRTFESTRNARPGSPTGESQQLVGGRPGASVALESGNGTVGAVRPAGPGSDKGHRVVHDDELHLGLGQEAVRVPDCLRDRDLPFARDAHALILLLP